MKGAGMQKKAKRQEKGEDRIEGRKRVSKEGERR